MLTGGWRRKRDWLTGSWPWVRIGSWVVSSALRCADFVNWAPPLGHASHAIKMTLLSAPTTQLERAGWKRKETRGPVEPFTQHNTDLFIRVCMLTPVTSVPCFVWKRESTTLGGPSTQLRTLFVGIMTSARSLPPSPPHPNDDKTMCRVVLLLLFHVTSVPKCKFPKFNK